MAARRLLVAAFVTVLLIPVVGWAQSPALPPIMKLAEIQPGMKGIGRTVIQGQKIDEFNIQIIGILQGGGGIINTKHLILYRASGPIIDRMGGTAAGMSGSPLFINGKLIGAHSAGYINMVDKHDIGLATPIEEMLRVLDLAPGSPQGLWPRTFVATRPIVVGDRRIEKVVIASDLTEAEQVERAHLPGVTAFIPASFPKTASGLSPRGRRVVEQALGLREPLAQYGGGPTAFAVEPISGGSSVGILLVRGDLTFGGICTATVRVGDRLLICGHPFESFGDVEYALTASEILTVIRVLERPFKEGNFGEIVGKIDQDRGTAIRGVLGQFPRMFAVRVTVTNQDTGKTVSKGMQVVRRRDIARLFATAEVLTALDLAQDQAVGGGTAKVRITLRGKGLPRDIVRENFFYHSRDMATAAVLDLPDALNFLFHNDLAPVDPIDASIDVTFSNKRVTAAITDAKVEQREVASGETLRVRLTLRPYQDSAQSSRVIDVPIPKNFPRGPAVLVIGSAGGSLPPEVTPEARLGAALAKEPEPVRGTSLNEAIDFVEGFGKNTDILIQVLPFGLPTEGREFTKFDVSASRLIDTNWVIQGSFQVPILIR